MAKPLHIGHLRSAIIGESLKRLYQYFGYHAIGDIHLGDWGLQMGLIIAELHERQPDLPYFDPNFDGEYPAEAPFTISELEEIYPTASAKKKDDPEFAEKAHTATFELQQGRRGYRAIWQHIMNVSVADLKKNYDNLDVHFESWLGESDADPYIPPMIEDMKKKGLLVESEGAVADLKKNYDNLDVHFESWLGESDADPYIPPMIEDMKKKGLLVESEGALVMPVAEETDKKEVPPCILVKSDGASIYATTDLATIVQRMQDFHPDKILYLTDKRQALHFEQVFRAARKSDIVSPETELEHLGFGTMNGSDGKPFKTRDGGVMRLEQLVSDMTDFVRAKVVENKIVAEDQVEATTKKIAMAALKYGDLSNQPTKDYVFDLDRFAAFEGNTGPYILYTIVRIKSILAKYGAWENLQIQKPEDDSAKELMLFAAFEGNTGPYILYTIVRIKSILAKYGAWENLQIQKPEDDSAKELMLSITKFGPTMESALKSSAPNLICAYIYDLAGCVNKFYHQNRILGEEDKEKQAGYIALIGLAKLCTPSCGSRAFLPSMALGRICRSRSRRMTPPRS